MRRLLVLRRIMIAQAQAIIAVHNTTHVSEPTVLTPCAPAQLKVLAKIATLLARHVVQPDTQALHCHDRCGRFATFSVPTTFGTLAFTFAFGPLALDTQTQSIVRQCFSAARGEA